MHIQRDGERPTALTAHINALLRLHKVVIAIVRRDKLCQRFMRIPGVGRSTPWPSRPRWSSEQRMIGAMMVTIILAANYQSLECESGFEEQRK